MSKDYNRIAAFEKAIAEKYGKDTVQDFRSQWEQEKEQEYLDQLKTRNTKRDKQNDRQEIKAGDIVIKKRDKKDNQSRICPVCKTYSFSIKDDLYMIRYDCCYRCYVDFVETNEASWKQGDRPDENYIQGILRGRK